MILSQINISIISYYVLLTTEMNISGLIILPYRKLSKNKADCLAK